MPSKGSIVHAFDGRLLETEHVPMHSAFVAPYVELPEELTLKEAFDFHSKFKKMNKAFTFDDLVSEALLTGSEYKMIRYFSSGMKQRIKLLMAFFSESDLLLLDEPCSNLDEQGIEWYRNMIKHHAAGKTIIVASNQKSEYEFCTEELVLNHFR